MMATTSTSSPFTRSYLLSLTSSFSNSRYPLQLTTLSSSTSSIFQSSSRKNSSSKLFCYSQSAISRRGTFDPELRSVLELATDSELYEIERILFGPSYFSPLLKSIENRGNADFIMIEEDFEERDNFIELLESRFLYLGADARSTLRGWRPSYRDILLSVRRKLSIPCSSKLSTEDLEVEIFLHLLQEYSSDITLQHGLSQWKVQAFAALKIGAVELKSMILKGGGMLTLAKVYQLLARRLSGKMLFQAANYQVRHELIRELTRMFWLKSCREDSLAVLAGSWELYVHQNKVTFARVE
ncbi:uncharacterized protein LOC113303153 isoform X4 [Papaver somniferum]|uniref:uncharacterized protein LOC113303153 isoform X4 n=1 Tax=Papaver somniferum TaxID=3469 RepID=UPI000E6F60F0|nr:uncharacterized protein LOC113303153 isoform X4 [Papaver somniferum]